MAKYLKRYPDIGYTRHVCRLYMMWLYMVLYGRSTYCTRYVSGLILLDENARVWCSVACIVVCPHAAYVFITKFGVLKCKRVSARAMSRSLKSNIALHVAPFIWGQQGKGVRRGIYKRFALVFCKGSRQQFVDMNEPKTMQVYLAQVRSPADSKTKTDVPSSREAGMRP